MVDFSNMNDEELFYSVGSSRPTCGGLRAVIDPGVVREQLEAEQAAWDEAVDEMERRDKERGFPFRIPVRR